MSQISNQSLVSSSKRVYWAIIKLPIYLIAIPNVIFIRLMRPLLLIRIGALFSQRIGHFAANTELYLCEQAAGINVPKQLHIDLFFVVKPVCNKELLKKWSLLIRIWPTWLLAPIKRINRLIPGWAAHEVGENTQMDRDINHLLDRYPPNLKFSSDEEIRGVNGLRSLGINTSNKFVCLNVRDDVYLESTQPLVDWSYHGYRDCNIQNFVLVAEKLAELGYYVIRMGVVVKNALQSSHPLIIDYAAKGMRTEFMDLYLGAKCEFCISVGSGFDAIPFVFRRPIVFVNHVPLGYLFTFADRFIALTKHHFSLSKGRMLTLHEILSEGLGFATQTDDYESCGVKLIENSPEEIKDVVLEMVQRLEGNWITLEGDEDLQQKFWNIFPSNTYRNEKPLHGEILSRYGAIFLRKNRWWLSATF